MIFKISSLCQCESVCVMDAQTIRPIVSKLGMVIEGRFVGNIGPVLCA